MEFYNGLIHPPPEKETICMRCFSESLGPLNECQGSGEYIQNYGRWYQIVRVQMFNSYALLNWTGSSARTVVNGAGITTALLSLGSPRQLNCALPANSLGRMLLPPRRRLQVGLSAQIQTASHLVVSHGALMLSASKLRPGALSAA